MRGGFISSFSGGITNSGKIVVTTANEIGIHVGGVAKPSTSAFNVGIANFSGGIVNSGTISAAGAAGDGIVVAGQATGISVGTKGTFTLSTFAGEITNSGTISAGGIGIYVGGTATGHGTSTISTFSGGITNSGLISAKTGIVINSHVLNFTSGVIANSGTISGTGGTAIDVSGFNNSITIDILGGSIAGNIVGNSSHATLDFAPSGTFTYANNFSGIQQANFTSGTVVLNGHDTADRGDGELGRHARRHRRHRVDHHDRHGGTLEPGTPGTAGTKLSVTGALTFDSGAKYLDTFGSGVASEASISGLATLGDATVTIAAGSTVAAGTTYTILTAAGGLSGTFNPTVTYGTSTGTISYVGEDVDLMFGNSCHNVTGAYTNSGSTPGSRHQPNLHRQCQQQRDDNVSRHRRKRLDHHRRDCRFRHARRRHFDRQREHDRRSAGPSWSPVRPLAAASAMPARSTAPAPAAAICITGVTTFAGGITNTARFRPSVQGPAHLSDTSFTGGITNSGLISANNYAIVLNTLGTFTGGITNSGTIISERPDGIATATYVVPRRHHQLGKLSRRASAIVDQCDGLQRNICNSGTISGATASSSAAAPSPARSSKMARSWVEPSALPIDGTSKITSTATGIAITGPTFTGGLSSGGTISSGASKRR